ncbi:MAG TPA: hypothetical protein VMX17_04275 [Candidatus Glassbacteria bacterium]|nr:hypothetical protein [Candidatus Glassbacteria bacterium]
MPLLSILLQGIYMSKRRKLSTEEVAQDISDTIKEERVIVVPELVSTGSTLLDLAISGGRYRGGGIPTGIIVEIFGPSSAGKSSLLTESASYVKNKGGQVMFLDPEARLDQEYARTYGLELEKENYHRPDTVTEFFDLIWNWKPKNADKINMIAGDSLAALSTIMEMVDGDKFGMRRAKEFSEGLRKTCRLIANSNWLVFCSNQERESPSGITTPGGKGIPYYSSLRIRITPEFKGSRIKKTKTIDGKTHEKVIGIKSVCEIKKSSIDEPFRQAPVSIIFNYGIDSIRDELQWMKDARGLKKYDCFGEECATIEKAISLIEENNLQDKLKNATIDLWQEINEAFKIERKRKLR